MGCTHYAGLRRLVGPGREHGRFYRALISLRHNAGVAVALVRAVFRGYGAAALGDDAARYNIMT